MVCRQRCCVGQAGVLDAHLGSADRVSTQAGQRARLARTSCPVGNESQRHYARQSPPTATERCCIRSPQAMCCARRYGDQRYGETVARGGVAAWRRDALNFAIQAQDWWKRALPQRACQLCSASRSAGLENEDGWRSDSAARSQRRAGEATSCIAHTRNAEHSASIRMCQLLVVTQGFGEQAGGHRRGRQRHS